MEPKKNTPHNSQVIMKDKCHKEGEMDKVKDEIDIMKKVKHPNCISFHGVCMYHVCMYVCVYVSVCV